MTTRRQTARHELGHAAAAAWYAHANGIHGAVAHLSVRPIQGADGTLGEFAVYHRDAAKARAITRAAAVGPLALEGNAVVAAAIKNRNPYHACLSDVDRAHMREHVGDPVDILAPTYALLHVTGHERLSKMANILVEAQYIEIPLFDLYPVTRIVQAQKRVRCIKFNAAFGNPLMRPVPDYAAGFAA